MNRILILDYGSQYTQLIARRVREAHVYSEIHPPQRDIAFIKQGPAGRLDLSLRGPARAQLRRRASEPGMSARRDQGAGENCYVLSISGNCRKARQAPEI